MKIVLFDHYAGSTEMGMEFRPYYMAREWIKAGHEVRIVAGDFSHLRIKNVEIERDFTDTEIDGITYTWIKTGEYDGNGLRRALTMFRYTRKLWLHAGKLAKAWQPDVVIASSTYPLETYAAQRLAKKSRALLIHEVHDMWPSTLYEIGGMSKHNPFVVLMQLAENSAYKHSDIVVSLLPCAEEYMKKHGLADGKFVHIPNGIVVEEWEDTEPLSAEHADTINRLHGEGKFVVGYFGSHAIAYSLDTLLDAAKKEAENNVVFVLVGKGVEKARLEKRREDEGIENVVFLPAIPKKQIPALTQMFDCTYMGALDSPLFRFGVCMNKMYDSMMSGRPVVCALTAPMLPISEHKCGIVVGSGDTDGIVAAVEKLRLMDPSERDAIGKNGRDAVLENYTYPVLAARFEELFHRPRG